MGRTVQEHYKTPEFREVLYYLFHHTVGILKSHGFRFWLDRGTLLGAWRNGQIVVGDDDVDLRIMNEDCIAIFESLRHALPEDLVVHALHHENVVRLPDNEHETYWFQNDDGEFLIANDNVPNSANALHSITALAVNTKGSTWNDKPNLDFYSCLVNRHHDCMPDDSPAPWIDDGERYLCVPSRRIESMLIPEDYVFPLSSLEFDGVNVPVPRKTARYLQHLLGYIGEDALFNIETGRWEPEA